MGTQRQPALAILVLTLLALDLEAREVALSVSRKKHW